MTPSLGTTRGDGTRGERAPRRLTPAGNPARGIALGLLAALPLWAAIAVILRATVRGW